MKKYEAVLFDLDGTLLPMDLNTFIKVYYGNLGKRAARLGLDVKEFFEVFDASYNEMCNNDGSKLNRDTFSRGMVEKYGEEKWQFLEGQFAEFYADEFNDARIGCQENPFATRMIETAREVADKVILATNSFFPIEAISSRLDWIGLSVDDFDYITIYNNSSYCKPNLGYFKEIVEKFNLNPEKCIMIGNDVAEDMVASQLGMDTFLVTYCLLTHGLPYDNYKHGNYPELLEYLNK